MELRIIKAGKLALKRSRDKKFTDIYRLSDVTPSRESQNYTRKCSTTEAKLVRKKLKCDPPPKKNI